MRRDANVGGTEAAVNPRFMFPTAQLEAKSSISAKKSSGGKKGRRMTTTRNCVGDVPRQVWLVAIDRATNRAVCADGVGILEFQHIPGTSTRYMILLIPGTSIPRHEGGYGSILFHGGPSAWQRVRPSRPTLFWVHFLKSTSVTQNIRTKAAFATSVFASLNHAQITRAENIKNNDASRLPGVYI